MHRFDVKTIKATQNSKRDQITMNLHRFDVQTIKNVELRCKPFKTVKVQKWSNYNELHQFDVKTSKSYELRLKTFKTTQTYETDQIIMNCIDLTSKRTKMLSYVANHSKPLKYKSDQNTMTCTDLMSKTSKQC